MTTRQARVKRRCGVEHYRSLHQNSAKYQQNNWLLDDLAALAATGGESILEVGCGNGLFLASASGHWRDVVGVDWVRSGVLDRVLREHPAIQFVQGDIADVEIGRRFDLLVSADFLEHLAPAALPAIIRKLHDRGRWCYHKIACYDDGHSHLSIFGPRRWLRLFDQAVPGGGYRIAARAYRNGRRTKQVVVITNITPVDGPALSPVEG